MYTVCRSLFPTAARTSAHLSWVTGWWAQWSVGRKPGKQTWLKEQKGSRMDPDDTLREMSLMAAKTLGAAYAGIDILPVEGVDTD